MLTARIEKARTGRLLTPDGLHDAAAPAIVPKVPTLALGARSFAEKDLVGQEAARRYLADLRAELRARTLRPWSGC